MASSKVPKPRWSDQSGQMRLDPSRAEPSYASFGPDAHAQIRHQAAVIARYKGLTYHDREDLEQSIACCALTALAKAPKGEQLPLPHRFVDDAIKRCMGALDEAGGKSLKCERSLDEFVYQDGTPLILADALDHDAIRRRWTDVTEAELDEIRLDIADVLAKLPVDLRQACEAIQFGRDSIEAARIARVRRSVLLKRLAKARPYFEEARARGAFRRFAGRSRQRERGRRGAARGD